MTRINVLLVDELTDQHLMAEYRELPMVLASARRSSPSKFQPSDVYTLNKGHVKFFYNKKRWLYQRYVDLIVELRNRGYDINPDARKVDFTNLDKFPQVDWQPDQKARAINLERIRERILQKPHWYRYKRLPLPAKFCGITTVDNK